MWNILPFTPRELKNDNGVSILAKGDQKLVALDLIISVFAIY
jgi:hypothetical protein